ncbi:hypothetical protein [Pedomonas mirosovicensis]|uniref:hypothetical protein n=1 Tax=Pedomonas mirosovicensis TaxID=2908641 RepID=UPI002169BC93|nr:hypothetical protein [Pedomonas mirosovicensis]MCH8684778.1 hypothetical protein [Pedomonas mirosovicensis]
MAGPSETHNAEDFAEQLKSLAHAHGQLAVGRLQILGFKAVEERLGDRWPQMRDRIPQIIEGTFRRRLSPRDVFRRHQELVYLVIFAELSVEEAQVKAHLLAEEIWQQLFGVGEAEGKLDVSLLTINLETNQVENVADLDTLLAQQFEKAALEAAALQKGAAAGGPAPPPAGAAASPTPAPTPAPAPAPLLVIEPDPTPAALQPTAPEPASHTYLSYAPLWTPGLNAVTSYYARMCLIGGPMKRVYGHDMLRRSSAPRDVYDFDLATLARVQAAALLLGRNRSPAVLVCQVHYTTLINSEARREYLALCAGLPRFAVRHLILEVGGFAEGFPAHTAFEIRHWLRTYCRAAWALLPPSPAAVHNLKEAGYAAVGFDARRLGMLSRLAGTGPQFVEAARKHRMRPFVHGIVMPQAVITAANAGFDFLSGDAVQRPFDKVPPPYRLTLDEISLPND